ncbi:hypothetical protein PR048_030399 [Dryococelus australis]|uniref:Uncharacterized protein n=1 Tax=Dryococelus australis TaxID=614101 RepID=A0ABQ9GBQ9_9NEOP|nr:hypothetical protein PR048_030399 [Dryococelus australis]
MAKVLSDQNKQIEKKKISRQFLKERDCHVMHKGDTDSSDDEDNKYFEEQNYSGYGRMVKHLLNKGMDSATNEGAKQCANLRTTWKRPLPPAGTSPGCLPGQGRSVTKPPSTAETDGDPIFGIRIV